VVIADEPTTALDLTTQRQILDLIRRLIIDERRAMILVTHDMGVVAQYCDSVAVMYAGRIVERGPTAAVLRNPLHQYTKALLDSMPRPGEEIAGIPGTAPSLANRPAGCPFAPRCTAATAVCTEAFPPIEERSGGRELACYHPVGAE
jgi:oligopeptide/dipeptide ABC transporter ATP-binding protein